MKKKEASKQQQNTPLNKNKQTKTQTNKKILSTQSVPDTLQGHMIRFKDGTFDLKGL